MNHSSSISHARKHQTAKPSLIEGMFLFSVRDINNAEVTLLANPYSALCRLKLRVVENYMILAGLLPTRERIRSMMREELARDVPEPLATEAAAELLAEILRQMRDDVRWANTPAT